MTATQEMQAAPGVSLGEREIKNGSMADCVSADDFPAWFYAEVVIDGEHRVVSIFHVPTHVGVVAYWYEDPENQHHGLPLLKSMQPILLGDYGSFLAEGGNMKVFVALCKAIDDLPDPLLTVQVIQWLNRRNLQDVDSLRSQTQLALSTITASHQRRRDEFERVMKIFTGAITSTAIF